MDTRGRHGGADRAHALPERAPPRPSPSHRVLVTRQRDERVALPGMRDEDLAGRLHDAGADSDGQVTRRVVDPPGVDITRPAKPRKLLTILGCAFVGAFLAVARVFLQEMFRRGLEDPAEIEQLGVQVYSAIPLSERQIELSQNRPRLLGKQRHSTLLAVAAPGDVAAEALRSLRTSLRFTQLGAPDNRLMVCGSSSQT